MFDLKKCMEQDGGKCLYVCLQDSVTFDARILSDDLLDDNDHSIVFAVRNSREETVRLCKSDGTNRNNSNCLENLPETITRYVAVIHYASGLNETQCFVDENDYDNFLDEKNESKKVTCITASPVTVNKGQIHTSQSKES